MHPVRTIDPLEQATLAARIAELGPWFHNFELAPGVWTNPSARSPGPDYPLSRWRVIKPLLPEISGKACLDVGCSSGFFALKLKELGASHVLGVDAGEQPQAINQARFAASTLGLDVEFASSSVYALQDLGRRFDVVLFMGVFYHLRHPLLALETVRAVSRDTMIFQTITTRHDKDLDELGDSVRTNVDFTSSTMVENRFPAMRFVEGALDCDSSCWFVPNVQAVAAMLRSCRFRLDQMSFPTEREVIVRCSAVDG
jgi:tRNA (mo5U34)-methyltransferase